MNPPSAHTATILPLFRNKPSPRFVCAVYIRRQNGCFYAFSKNTPLKTKNYRIVVLCPL